jgi:hypothetical protein
MSAIHAHHHDQGPPFGLVFRGIAGFGIAGLVAAGVVLALLRTEAPDIVYLAAGALGGVIGGIIAYRAGSATAED